MRLYTRTPNRPPPTLARLTLIARAIRDEEPATMDSRHLFTATVTTRAIAEGYASPAETDLRAAVASIYATRTIRWRSG